MSGSHLIAAIANREGLHSQSLLELAAANWREMGLCVAGVLAENNNAEGGCSAAFLRDIASGQRYSIQLDAVLPATTCHLDSAGLDQACAKLLSQIDSSDVVILSKFGKTEAMGQGLHAVFASAVATATPLLTTVSSKHIAAWTEFAPQAHWLEPDIDAIQQWWETVRA